MNDLKLLFDYIITHKIVIFATAFGAFAGAFGGALAFYNGWLG